MSLLLDALRKADRERSAQHSPAGLDSYTAEPDASRRWLPIVLVLLVLVVLLLGGGLLWLLWGDEPEQVTQAPVSSTTPEPEPPTPELQPLVPVKEPAASVSAAPSSQAVASTAPLEPDVEPNRLGEAHQPPGAEVGATEQATSASQASLDPAVAELYRHKPAEESQPQPQAPAVSAATQQPAPPPQSEPQPSEPPSAPANTLAGFPNVGGIRALPLAAQNDIPTLMYGQHNYRLGGDSSIVLNGKTLREGDSLGGGLAVDAIVADGVIMRYRDHHFALKALSSWVNM